MTLTKLQLIAGLAYTELTPADVRQYLQGGVKAGTISGFLNADGTVPIIIGVHAIEFIYV